MSRSKQPRALYGKAACTSSPPTRRLGPILDPDSFGSNEDVWDVLVASGVLPQNPVSDACGTALPFTNDRKQLRVSLLCPTCRARRNIKFNTPFFLVWNIEEIFGSLE